jgi:RecJ-like exonuclease
MTEEIQKIVMEAEKAKVWLKEADHVRVVSHYDADGITSASIMAKTLVRMGKDFHLSMVKQLSSRVLESLAHEKRRLYVFLDMGSGQIEGIKKTLAGSRVIICDHHQPGGDANESVVHINSTLAGIENSISGSGVTYLFCKTLNPINEDLSQLAVIGAIGDSQIDAIGLNWGLSGPNKIILKSAEAQSKIRVSKGLRLWGRYTRPLHKALAYSIDPHIPGISGSESASIQFLTDLGIPTKKGDDWRTIADLTTEEQKTLASGMIKERVRANQENPEYIFGDVYDLLDKEGDFRDANEFATILNACGKMGQASLGVALCLNVKDAFPKVKDIFESYRREIGKGISWIEANLKNPDIVKDMTGVYVFAGDNVSEHMISNVISVISHSGLLPAKPLFGIANAEDGIKISARAHDSLVDGGLKLNEIMSSVAGQLGGEGGGHMGAAAAVIPRERQEEFINMTELILTSIIGENNGHEEQAKTEGRCGSPEERSDAGEGSQAGRHGGREDTTQKMERKGLVQYIGS